MKRHTSRVVAGVTALVAVGALLLTSCSGSGFGGGGDSASPGALTSSKTPLNILIASSGDAETKAVKDAVAAWSKQSGTQATVQVASDLNQQLAQGFAAGSPPDLFYMSPEALAGYAKNGSVKAYGDMLSNKSDFYPSLVQNFTVGGKFYCAPKDFSTLALIINTDLWAKAGLTDADVPTTWDQLTAVSKKLTTGGVAGLGFGAQVERIGVFMAQAGGGLVTDGKATADSKANVEALQYVKENLNGGNFAYASKLGAGWGGEAFGKQLAAMVIEGNWIDGAMKADYPNVKYIVAQLPAGPKGKGTLQYTNCWGMATDSKNQAASLKLVEYLTNAKQQLAFATAFGPMPSVQSAAAQWKSDNPSKAAFLDGAKDAQFLPSQAGAAQVISDFDAQLLTLATSDPATILKSVQGNLTPVVG